MKRARPIHFKSAILVLRCLIKRCLEEGCDSNIYRLCPTSLHKCRRLNWDTLSRIENSHFKTKIQPNFLEISFSAVFQSDHTASVHVQPDHLVLADYGFDKGINKSLSPELCLSHPSKY